MESADEEAADEMLPVRRESEPEVEIPPALGEPVGMPPMSLFFKSADVVVVGEGIGMEDEEEA